MSNAIETLMYKLALLLVWLAGLFLVAMMVQVFADVAMKYLFNSPIPGTAEIVARWYMVAAVFLPLPYVEMRNSGISVDLFYNMFGPGLRRLIMLLAYLGQTLFFGLLAYQSTFDALKSYSRGEYIDGQIAVVIWPAFFFLPIGLWLATAISIYRIFQTLTRSDWEDLLEFNSYDEPDRPVKDSV